MCGIIGINSKELFTTKWAFERLKRLEYRGYDSYGYFDGQDLIKEIGHIKIHEKKDKDDPDAKEFLKNLIDLQFIDKQVNLIKLRNNLILITMDKENFEKTENEWKTKNQNFTNYFNSLLKRGLNIG